MTRPSLPATPPAAGQSGGSVNVDYYGSIKVDRTLNGNFDNILIDIAGKTGGTINIAAGGTPVNARVENELLDIGGEGIFISKGMTIPAAKPSTTLET